MNEKSIEYRDFRKTKMVVEFNDRESASIKSFAVKKRNEIKMTSHFMSGKLLMFAKLILKSFIYDLSETFYFLTKEIIDIYKKCLVEKIEVFHILTDTYSTALKFILISDQSSDITEEKFRDTIFEATIASKIYKRFDTSHEFWDIFGSRKESRRKKLGYYKIENIHNPSVVSLAVNPKEYLTMLKNPSVVILAVNPKEYLTMLKNPSAVNLAVNPKEYLTMLKNSSVVSLAVNPKEYLTMLKNSALNEWNGI